MRKLRLRLDQGPVAGETTSLNCLHFAGGQPDLVHWSLSAAFTSALSTFPFLPLSGLSGRAHVSGHLQNGTTDESFHQTFLKKLFCVRPCLKASPNQAGSQCQHHVQCRVNSTPSFPLHSQRCPQVSTEGSGRGGGEAFFCSPSLP